jgi:ribosomal 30S subunit maturation factor RimM
MNNSIEAEITRLVREISAEEEKVRYHKKESIVRFSDVTKKEEAQTAKMYEDSIERKIRLLEILKR